MTSKPAHAMPSTWLGSARTTPRVAGLAKPTEEYVDSQLPKVMSAAASTGHQLERAPRVVPLDHDITNCRQRKRCGHQLPPVNGIVLSTKHDYYYPHLSRENRNMRTVLWPLPCRPSWLPRPTHSSSTTTRAPSRGTSSAGCAKLLRCCAPPRVCGCWRGT